jgi:hypothetical protein
MDAFARARVRVNELLSAYQRPSISFAQERELREMMEHTARHAGMDKLPSSENL